MANRIPFEPYTTQVPPSEEWEWRGDEESGTRRSVAMLVTPDMVGNTSVMVALARIPKGQAAPWHKHDGHEEFVYVLEGEAEFECEGKSPVHIGPGSVNLIPPGAVHRHSQTGPKDFVFLWGYAPPGEQLTS